MDFLPSGSGWLLAVPVIAIVGSLLVRKLLKISFRAALAGVGLPLVLPLNKLPFLSQFSDLPQAYLLGGVWGSILFCLIAWALLRPFVSAAVTSLGVLKLGYFVLLGAALMVAALLVSNPQALSESFPGWKGSAGILLLAVSCISVSKALWGMFRSSLLVAVWGGVSLVLASSIFLDKLPHEIRRDDLTKIRGVIAFEVINKALSKLDILSRRGAGALGFVRTNDQKRPPHNEETEV